jgi:hypothetical protein
VRFEGDQSIIYLADQLVGRVVSKPRSTDEWTRFVRLFGCDLDGAQDARQAGWVGQLRRAPRVRR